MSRKPPEQTTGKTERKAGLLPICTLLAFCLLIQGDTRKEIKEWVRSCDDGDLISLKHSNMHLQGFQADPLRAKEKVSWPEGLKNPINSIRPTFDDGPHPNDLKLIDILKKYPFNTPIFYYNGINFFTDEALTELGIDPQNKEKSDDNWKINPGKWMEWLKNNIKSNLNESADHYERRLMEFLRSKLDPNKLAIAKAVHDAGFTIGFHGMVHPEEDSSYHMQNYSEVQFHDDLNIFERIVEIAIGNEDYSVEHVRPPYGAGTNNTFSPPFVQVCEAEGIDVRNWSFSSFDWQVDATRGARLLADILRTVTRGRTPDILFHSTHQDGTTMGNFGEMLSVWSGQVLSLLAPERDAERAEYRNVLENMLADTPQNISVDLASSKFELGSPEQITVDSAYNTDLIPQFHGAVQSKLSKLTSLKSGRPIKADGYVGDSTVDNVKQLAPKFSSGETRLGIAKVLKDPGTFLKSQLKDELEGGINSPDFDNFPSTDDLMNSSTTFANRGLQVKSVATDILCQLEKGKFNQDFLESYNFQGLFIDPLNIPTYIAMYDFLKKSGLDDQTIARIMATALLESGVKSELDRYGIGKGTVEWAGDNLNKVFDNTDTVPGALRRVGLKKQGDVLQFGLGSIGPGQVPASMAWAMFEAILQKELSQSELKKILNSPQGAALAIYLSQKQYEVRLGSTVWVIAHTLSHSAD